MTTIYKPLDGFGPESDGGNDEIKRLRTQHDLWKLFRPKWRFYLSAYEGGDEFLADGNIFKHARENEQDYKDRVQRAHNLNYCESLVDFFTNFIFSEAIDRSGGPDAAFYSEFVKDVNRKNETIDTFMRQLSDDLQIFGMSYVLVDAPIRPDVEVVTKQDEIRFNLRPYWVLIKPDEIIDWATDEFGKFYYVKRRQLVDVFSSGEHHLVERFTEFSPMLTSRTDVDVTNPAKPYVIGHEVYSNDLGTIPLVVARYKRSKSYPHMGLSFLRDFAGNNREIVNLTSLLQEFLYRQAFNILVKEVEMSVPLQDQTEGDVGTSNMMEIPKGAAMPQYISPPADPAQFIQDERSRIKQEMFVRAAQDFVSELFNGSNSSGFSQAQSFSKTVPFISSRAETLEATEAELMSITMRMLGKEWKGKIKYKDRYELTNLSDALTQLQILVRDFMIPSETFVKEELKRMVREYDGKLPSEMLAKIESEIEEMEFSSWSATQKKALVGNQGVSPAKQQEDKSSGTLKEIQAEAKKPNVASTKKLK